jgi:protein-tyrosine-phosphatase
VAPARACRLDHARSIQNEDVPDPYGGGPDDFDEVLDIVTRTGRALLEELKAGHDA